MVNDGDILTDSDGRLALRRLSDGRIKHRAPAVASRMVARAPHLWAFVRDTPAMPAADNVAPSEVIADPLPEQNDAPDWRFTRGAKKFADENGFTEDILADLVNADGYVTKNALLEYMER